MKVETNSSRNERHRVLLSRAFQEYVKGLLLVPVEVFAFNNWNRRKFEDGGGLHILDDQTLSSPKACAESVEKNGIDILYAQGFRSLLFFYRVKWHCHRDKPRIYVNCHYSPLWNNPVKSFLFVLASCLLSDGLVFIVGWMQKKWKWMTSIFGLRTFHVANPVEIGRFPEVKKACSHRIVIGCIGRVEPLKQQKILVDIVCELRKRGFDVVARIAGDAEDENYVREIRDRIVELKMEDFVTFDPRIPYDDVPKWLLQLDICVYPSLMEVMPFSVLEAMATGLPIVAYDTGGVCEEVREGVNGRLICTNAIADYVSAVADIISNGKWHDMSAASRRLCETEFSFDEYAGKMRVVFDGKGSIW